MVTTYFKKKMVLNKRGRRTKVQSERETARWCEGWCSWGAVDGSLQHDSGHQEGEVNLVVY